MISSVPRTDLRVVTAPTRRLLSPPGQVARLRLLGVKLDYLAFVVRYLSGRQDAGIGIDLTRNADAVIRRVKTQYVFQRQANEALRH
jgi:hypothetical protein